MQGWSVQDSLIKVQLSKVPGTCPRGCCGDPFGPVGPRGMAFSHGRDKGFPVAFDVGTVYVIFHLGDQAELPAFITLVEGSWWELVKVHNM